MPTLSSDPSAIPGATLDGRLVPVVEDDDDTRFLYAESLGHLGYRAAGESLVAMLALTDPGNRRGALPRRRRVEP